MTKEVMAAANHIRNFFGDLTLVVFNQDQQWQYFGENFNPLKFGNLPIDGSLLDAAMDSVDTLPVAFDLKLRDSSGFPINQGDLVLVPEPDDTDIHSHSFSGYVKSFRNGNVIVEDMTDECFEIEPERLTVE